MVSTSEGSLAPRLIASPSVRFFYATLLFVGTFFVLAYGYWLPDRRRAKRLGSCDWHRY